MNCHKCPHNGKFEGVEWSKTPCAKCSLRGGSSHTMEYFEEFDPENPNEAEEAAAEGRPYDRLVGNENDPMIPLSVLGTAMACWVSTTLPAREIFRLSMCKTSLIRIAVILGCSRQAVSSMLSRAIKANPVMAALMKGNGMHKRVRRKKSEK